MQSALFENILLNATHSALARTKIPAFLYGCAWKKERTADLVYQALSSGFKGIDVAAQPRHYREDLAGDGLRRALSEGKVVREELFVNQSTPFLRITFLLIVVQIQTKFTSVDGQDPSNLPYDPRLTITEQVKRSIASSLHNLRNSNSYDDTYIDSLVLHSPLRTIQDTQEAWRACENFVPAKIKNLGISNTSLEILEFVWKSAKIKPSVVQNRFYRDTEYDIPLRRFCREHGIVYQSFWTLSANPRLLRHSSVELLAKATMVEKPVALYCLVLGLDGTVILNGTQNHMKSDLEGLEKVRHWALENKYDWENTLKHFKDVTGDTSPELMPEDVDIP